MTRQDRTDPASVGDASGALYSRWWRTILDLCVRRLGNLEEAEGVAQEVLLRALRAHDTNGLRSFPAYALRIAHNLTTDLLRRRKLERGRRDPAGPGAVEGDPELAEHSRLRREVDTLPEPYREVVELHYVKGLSFAEIADVLSMSKNGVFARHERAVTLLRARFAIRRT